MTRREGKREQSRPTLAEFPHARLAGDRQTAVSEPGLISRDNVEFVHSTPIRGWYKGIPVLGQFIYHGKE